MLMTQHLKNQKGMAALELIPIAIVCVLLLSFSFGFFGVIHTGILNGIAARNYAFETFNHRADLRYFRASTELTGSKLREVYFGKLNFRVHSIVSEKRPGGSDEMVATTRPIAFGWDFGKPDIIAATNEGYHNQEVHTIKDDGTRYTAKEGVNPVWIQSTYGICLTSRCQPD